MMENTIRGDAPYVLDVNLGHRLTIRHDRQRLQRGARQSQLTPPRKQLLHETGELGHDVKLKTAGQLTDAK